MWVVKLGGSLAWSPHLRPWLAVLAGRHDLVVVPGGGPFAEQVRIAQGRWGFADAAAHHMALLGMEQYGRMLCALEPSLRPAATLEAIRGFLRDGSTPVWMPVPMVAGEPEVGQNWDVTSDSLAAWLCRRLAADGLVLVKSAPAGSLAGDLRVLSARGIVDAAFPRHAERLGAPIRLLSRDEPGLLGPILDGAQTGAGDGSLGALGLLGGS